MAENAETINVETENTAEAEVKTFTQEEVNQLIQSRLAQERKAREKEDAERKRKSDLDKLDGEQRLKAEHEQAMKELNESLASARRETAELKVGKKLATLGYDADFAPLLIGATDDESEANVEKFDKMVQKLVDERARKSLASGAPRVPGKVGADDAIANALYAAANATRRPR